MICIPPGDRCPPPPPRGEFPPGPPNVQTLILTCALSDALGAATPISHLSRQQHRLCMLSVTVMKTRGVKEVQVLHHLCLLYEFFLATSQLNSLADSPQPFHLHLPLVFLIVMFTAHRLYAVLCTSRNTLAETAVSACLHSQMQMMVAESAAR